MRSLLSKLKDRVTKDLSDNKLTGEVGGRLKSIFTFFKPKESQDVIENLEEFKADLFGDYGDEELVGRLKKKFVRLHSANFPRLASDIQACYPNCHFVIYFNEKRVALTGELPENVHVLMKEIPTSATLEYNVERNQMYAEAVSPHILNFFGCDTVYNETLVQDGRFNVLSLYCIKPNHRFYLSLNLNDEANISDCAKMKSNLDAIDEKLNVLNDVITLEEGEKKPKIDHKKIKEDYVYTYLVRSLLLGDRDFKERNYGFILDREKNVVLTAPNFDLEFCFNRSAEHTLNVKENLEFIYKNYPEVLNRFMRNLESINKKQANGKPKYKEIFESIVKDKVVAEDFIYAFESNAGFIERKILEIKKDLAWSWN